MAEGRGIRGALQTRSPRTVFWTSWLVLSAMSGLWAVANPMGAAPDEPSHIVRAAGLVSEQTLGVSTRPGVRELDLPWIFGMTHEMPGCYAFIPDVPASCWPIDFTGIDEVRTTVTTADSYNPLYYAVVGLPSLLPPSLEMLYLMRLASVLLTCGLLALGMRSVAEVARRRWTVAGVAVAIAPMVVFMNSTVNPNAVEASAGVGLWLTLLVALRHPDPSLVTRRWLRAGVLVFALVNAKALSPVFLAVIVITAVALAPWSIVVATVRDRRSWPGIALGTVGAAVAAIWTLMNEQVSGLDTTRFPEFRNPWTALEGALRLTTFYYEGLVGRFGWLDTRPPETVYSWFSAALGLLVVLALAMTDRRGRMVLAALAATVVILPIALQVPVAAQVGLPWQGRYLAAVAVGVPLVAGVLLDRVELPNRLTRNLGLLLFLMIGVVQVVSFGANLRRYVAGVDAPWFEPIDVPWHPPLPATPLMVTYLLVVAGYVWFLLWLAHDAQPADPPAGPPPAVSTDADRASPQEAEATAP